MKSRWLGKVAQKMAEPWSNGSVSQRKVVSHTLTGLKRWSCHSGDLSRKLCNPFIFELSDLAPAVNAVKAIHVYDFDNTRTEPSHSASPSVPNSNSLHKSVTKSEIMAPEYCRLSTDTGMLQ